MVFADNNSIIFSRDYNTRHSFLRRGTYQSGRIHRLRLCWRHGHPSIHIRIHFLHLGGAISWGSERQSCTAISTTEAEYVAASNATQEAVWIQRLLSQIGQLPPGPVRILCDNQSAISLVHNPAHHQRTKHIDVKFHFIREKQASNFIDIMYIDTQHQPG